MSEDAGIEPRRSNHSAISHPQWQLAGNFIMSAKKRLTEFSKFFPGHFSSISPILWLQLLIFFLWSLSSPLVGSAEHFCFYARKATVLALEMSGEAIVLQQNYIFSQRHFTYYDIYIKFSPKKSCLVARKTCILYMCISS